MFSPGSTGVDGSLDDNPDSGAGGPWIYHNTSLHLEKIMEHFQNIDNFPNKFVCILSTFV